MVARYEPTSETPVQFVVGVLNDLFMSCLDVQGSDGKGGKIDVTDNINEAAYDWCRSQLRERGYRADAIDALFEDHESHENMPIYDDYYMLRGLFVRKCLTAAAAAL